MNEICDLLERHCHENVTTSSIPRLTLCRMGTETDPAPVVYYPLFCFIAQGRKRIHLGGETYDYDADNYLVTSVDLPVTGQVLEAPFLGLTLSLDPVMLAELLVEAPPPADPQASRGMVVNRLSDDLRDPVLRLLRLLDRPQDIPIMAPLIEREILYRLLLGPRGELLRQRALPASPLSRIGRVLQLIKDRFNETLRIEELARFSGMSAASFHRHFRAVTALSPLQYQKQIRLQEARRLLLADDSNAASVGFEVGYESPSQFSREYRRLFGVPPGKDRAALLRSVGFGA